MRRMTGMVLLFSALFVQSAAAQSNTTQTNPARPFFTYQDGLLAVVFVAGVGIAAQFDRALAHNLQEQSRQENRALHKAAGFFRFMGQPAPQIIGPALYITGRLTHQQRIASLGLHGTEAMLLSTILTGVPKIVIGRARPYVSHDSSPSDYALLRGLKGRDYQSFPSGHATTAFAVASAVTAEFSHWSDGSGWFPASKVLIGATMYGGASMVALSRMYHNDHWASDILAGAAIGTFSGIKVVRYNYRHPTNHVERWFLSFSLSPGSNGRRELSVSVVPVVQ